MKFQCKVCLPPDYKEQIVVVSAKDQQEAEMKILNYVKVQSIITEVTLHEL